MFTARNMREEILFLEKAEENAFLSVTEIMSFDSAWVRLHYFEHSSRVNVLREMESRAKDFLYIWRCVIDKEIVRITQIRFRFQIVIVGLHDERNPSKLIHSSFANETEQTAISWLINEK